MYFKNLFYITVWFLKSEKNVKNKIKLWLFEFHSTNFEIFYLINKLRIIILLDFLK